MSYSFYFDRGRCRCTIRCWWIMAGSSIPPVLGAYTTNRNDTLWEMLLLVKWLSAGLFYLWLWFLCWNILVRFEVVTCVVVHLCDVDLSGKQSYNLPIPVMLLTSWIFLSFLVDFSCNSHVFVVESNCNRLAYGFSYMLLHFFDFGFCNILG
jgi:hypothetical protein